ncbi:MAG: hypothetical protein DRJ01_03560 [Bacteroidetes bacterium]|nr:MAG: hypothetical protein DRJ01_03560 [Bacteroidota bacterium]
MQKLFPFIVIVLLISINSCKKDNFITNSGEVITKEFLLDDFSQLEIDKYFNVYITDDTINKIVFEGGENLLENIETQIQNLTLKINNNNKVYFLKKYEKVNVYLSSYSLKKIIIKEPSNIFSTNCIKRNSFEIDVRADVSTVNIDVDCDEFFLKIYDTTGDFIINGKSKYSFVYFRGSAVVNANNLITNSIEITNCSTGDAYINVKDKIKYSIIRNGNIYYSGGAYDIKGETSSSGKLIKL